SIQHECIPISPGSENSSISKKKNGLLSCHSSTLSLSQQGVQLHHRFHLKNVLQHYVGLNAASATQNSG
ncbi:MAG: hypothetical protein ACRC9V_05035, partial [Aeromonas sp.]